MKPETVLITRTEPGASKTAGRAAERGFDPIVSPLARIDYLQGDLDLSGFDALAVTSRHGVRAVAKASEKRDLPVFAVGTATAEAARRSGFEEVRSADGDSAALAGLIGARLGRGDRILHARGDLVAGDLAATLQARGFDVHSRILYHTVETGRLSAEALTALDSMPGPVLLVHSPAGAERLVRACRSMGVALEPRRAAAISERAGEPLRIAGIGRIETAHSPDDAALLDAAARLTAGPSPR